jgi:hypothetical protein
MASEWFYTLNGEQSPTPATSEQLRQFAASGQLLPTDMVWREGMPNWVPASSIKGLFGSRSAAPAPATAPAAEFPPLSGEVPAERPRRGGRRRREEKEAAEDEMPGMNPILVVLLSICTCHLFGLFYAYQVCSAYTALGARRSADAAGRPLGKARHPYGVLLLSYLTLGIYFYYWFYCILRECADYSGRRDFNARVELALMLLLPPYAVYVAVFRLPEVVRTVQRLAGVPESTALNYSFLFLIPCMFPALPMLAMMCQDALNQVWFAAP